MIEAHQDRHRTLLLAITLGLTTLAFIIAKTGRDALFFQGSGGLFQKRASPTWWISYSVRGKLIRESAHSPKKSDGRKLLKKRLGEIALGKPVGPDVEKTTFEEMAVMIINDYKANSRRSLARVEDAIGHLREYFHDYRAAEITGDKVTAYVTYRQEQKAAAATINNELAVLLTMLSLGVRSDKIVS